MHKSCGSSTALGVSGLFFAFFYALNYSKRFKKLGKLTPKESRFLNAHISGKSRTEAYLTIYPDVTRESAGVLGSRMLKRIKKKSTGMSCLKSPGSGRSGCLKNLNGLSGSRKLSTTRARR